MKIAFIGSGAWATALASVANDNHHQVMIYGIMEDEVNDININHQNSKYFKDVKLDPAIVATQNLGEALNNATIVVLAIPSSQIASVVGKINPFLHCKPIIVNVAKGFDPITHERLSITIRKNIDEDKITGVCSLIGPSHAEEVIIKLYTAICAVSQDIAVARVVQEAFANKYLRIYSNNDEIGSEYGAAAKNVIALASGILSGLGYGDNTRAALMTRGLAEIARYGVAFGGEMSTYLGLTGLGDLIVTCSSKHSRNFMAGYQIGCDNGAEKFLKENTKTVEGISACQILYLESKKRQIEMPIVDAVYNVLFANANPRQEIAKLMQRSLKDE